MDTFQETMPEEFKDLIPLDDIEELALKIKYRDERIEILTETMDRLKDLCYLKVEMEYEIAKENGDPDARLLSNERKRAIEVKSRLQDNEEYTRLYEDLAFLKREQTTWKIILAAKRRKFIRECCQNNIPI